MLTQTDNELVSRIGAGTPMGDLLRQYWLPVLLPSEVEVDGPPLRVRLLGENLIAYRDTEGRFGLLADNCSHRGASLFYGRNEDSGLRCVYHGWKYDVAGNCVDMPNEPQSGSGMPDPYQPGSVGAGHALPFKDKIHHTAYPCVEHGGVVWTYMGMLSEPPPLPELDWTLVLENQRYLAKRVQHNNWVQALEGDIDQSHTSFLHSQVSSHRPGPFQGDPGNTRTASVYKADDKHPRFEALDTEYGVLIGARRDIEDDRHYWRITQYMMPFHTMTGPYGPNPSRQARAWVPMDDENVMLFGCLYHPTRPLTEEELARCHTGGGASFVGDDNFLPPTTEPGGRWQPKARRENDYFFDQELQRTKQYAGIPEFWAQDAAMQEGMGPIYDRTQEHLGTSDTAIIQVRRRLINAAKLLRDDGITQPTVTNPSLYHVRGAAVVLPRNVSWVDATEEQRLSIPGVNQDGA